MQSASYNPVWREKFQVRSYDIGFLHTFFSIEYRQEVKAGDSVLFHFINNFLFYFFR
jgi:hypothetical protein